MFTGFSSPEQNWTKLPNEMIEILAESKSLSEIKVLLYILRHTWGWQEYGVWKKITLDEFTRGIRNESGKRLDNGCGLTEASVVDGLRRAEESGYIQVSREGEDKARLKKFYRITTKEDLKNIASPIAPIAPSPIAPRDRTVLNKGIKENIVSGPSGPVSRSVNGGFFSNGNGASSSTKEPSQIFAEKLYTALAKKNKIVPSTNYSKWASEIKAFLGKIDASRFENVLNWYLNHIGERYIVRAYSAASFCSEFIRIEDRMLDEEREKDPRSDEEKAEEEKSRKSHITSIWNNRNNPAPKPPEGWNLLNDESYEERGEIPPYLLLWGYVEEPPENELLEIGKELYGENFTL